MRILISLVSWILVSAYFVTFLSVALVLSYLLPFKTIDPLLKAMMRGFFRLLFIRVEVQGLEHLDPERSFIFIANHSSMFDIPAVAGFIPGYLRGIEASRQHNWPLYGWAMGRLGNLPIERDDVHSSISTMRRAADYLKSGGNLIIFPEGQRTITGHLLPFKKLPFHLAKRSGMPIVPIAISGMFEINNKTSWIVKPGPVRMQFGETISEEEISRLSTVELRDLAEERVKAMLKLSR